MMMDEFSTPNVVEQHHQQQQYVIHEDHEFDV
jgi:hypothetical protein